MRTLEKQIAELEIGCVYDYGRARLIRQAAEIETPREPHVLTSLANMERDLAATLEIVREVRLAAMVGGDRAQS